jgi:Ca2+/H+ antiporter
MILIIPLLWLLDKYELNIALIAYGVLVIAVCTALGVMYFNRKRIAAYLILVFIYLMELVADSYVLYYLFFRKDYKIEEIVIGIVVVVVMWYVLKLIKRTVKKIKDTREEIKRYKKQAEENNQFS